MYTIYSSVCTLYMLVYSINVIICTELNSNNNPDVWWNNMSFFSRSFRLMTLLNMHSVIFELSFIVHDVYHWNRSENKNNARYNKIEPWRQTRDPLYEKLELCGHDVSVNASSTESKIKFFEWAPAKSVLGVHEVLTVPNPALLFLHPHLCSTRYLKINKDKFIRTWLLNHCKSEKWAP